jgi:hypothetical protein
MLNDKPWVLQVNIGLAKLLQMYKTVYYYFLTHSELPVVNQQTDLIFVFIFVS